MNFLKHAFELYLFGGFGMALSFFAVFLASTRTEREAFPLSRTFRAACVCGALWPLFIAVTGFVLLFPKKRPKTT